MAAPTATNLNNYVPISPANDGNVSWQADALNPRDVSAYMTVMTGPSVGGSGVGGGVPVPPAGSAAVPDFLRANGTWDNPATTFAGVDPWTAMLAPALITPPVVGSLTLGNAGVTGTIAANAGGAVYMKKQGAGGNDFFHAYKTAPATPWTFTIGCVIGMNPDGNTLYPGIGMRQSSTGKIVLFLWGQQTGAPTFVIANWTNYTTPSSNSVAHTAYFFGPLAWLRVTNNGTNFIFSVAVDGQNFKVVATISVTAFLTGNPDQVGIGIIDVDSTVLTDALFVHWAGI